MLMPLALVPLALKDRRYLIPSALATALILVAPHGSGRFGLNLWIGTWERNGDWYLAGLSEPDFPSYAFQLPSERETVERAWLKEDATFTRLALSRMETHPLSTAKAWIERYPRLWIGTRTDALPMRLPRHSFAWWMAKSAFLMLNMLTLALGFWGLSKERGLFAIPVLYIALIYVPFHNCEARYSLPALPFLYYYASTLLKSNRAS
jgi:hypothetical protein